MELSILFRIKILIDDVTRNIRGTRIDLKNYRYDINPYTTPCDGYAWVDSDTSNSGYIRLIVQDPNGNILASLYMNVIEIFQVDSIFVRKGMKLSFYGSNIAGTSYNIWFYGLDG